MQNDELEVKGTSILSKLFFVRERFGAEAEQELASFVAEAGHPQILDGSWYPFSLYESVLEQIAHRHYGGDLERLRQVGEDSAHRALTGTYQIYGQMGLSRFLSRLGALHNRFYSHGDVETKMDDENHCCAIRLFGASSYSEADLQVAAGFYVGAAQEMGLDEVRCDFRRVGGEIHFDLVWA